MFPRLVTGAILFCYVALITWGSFDVIRVAERGAAYDSLSKHLLSFSFEVDSAAIEFEGFKVGGKLFMYQGPFPALTRLPLNLLFPQFYGQWPAVSCLFASMLCLLALHRIFYSSLAGHEYLLAEHRDRILARLLFGFGLGTPLCFLNAYAWIHHEAILWGLVGSLWALYFALEIGRHRQLSVAAAIGFGVASGVALLSRLTLGLPLLATGVVLVAASLRRVFRKQSREIAATTILCCLIGTACLLQAYYNYVRFGSIFRAIDYSNFYLNPEHFGGEFNLWRLPDALYNYFVPRGGSFMGVFPYFRLVQAHYFSPHLFTQWREGTISLFLCSPWLLWLAGRGAARLYLRPVDGWELRLIGGILLLGTAPILLFYFVTQRYSTEFLPPLVLFSSYYVSSCGFEATGKGILPKEVAVMLIASVIVTVLSSIAWVMRV